MIRPDEIAQTVLGILSAPISFFIKEQKKMILLYKSLNTSIYATDRPKVNGHYEIEEGWRVWEKDTQSLYEASSRM